MWIVILNFCLFLLLIGFFFYGIRKWSALIADFEDDDREEDDNRVIDGRQHRLPLWLLIIGAGLVSLAGNLAAWFS